MGTISIWHWLILIIAGFLVCYPAGRILRRTGFSAWWALLYIVPLANVIGLWMLAYRPWPRDTAGG